MNLIKGSGLPQPGWFPVSLFIWAFFSSMLLCSSPFAAHAAEPVSFSWQANPPADYVLGYRLYYGSTSRFDYAGKLRADFSYDYYIDFNKLERCVSDGTGTNCILLSSDDVKCSNLSGDFPRCILYNLQGRLYVAMTAYNAQAESDYTSELTLNFGVVSPVIRAALQQINVLLLEKGKSLGE